jgi:hypothetical protein
MEFDKTLKFLERIVLSQVNVYHRFINLSLGIYWYNNMPMKKIMLSLPEEMVEVLEKERKERYLETIPETVRLILSDYLRTKTKTDNK